MSIRFRMVFRETKWTQSIAVGDRSFLEQIKDRLGIRAQGRKIQGSEGEYQLREVLLEKETVRGSDLDDLIRAMRPGIRICLARLIPQNRTRGTQNSFIGKKVRNHWE